MVLLSIALWSQVWEIVLLDVHSVPVLVLTHHVRGTLLDLRHSWSLLLLNELRDLLILLVKLLELFLTRHLEPLSALAKDLGGWLVHLECLRLLCTWSLLAATLQIRLNHVLGWVILVLRFVVDHFHQCSLGCVQAAWVGKTLTSNYLWRINFLWAVKIFKWGLFWLNLTCLFPLQVHVDLTSNLAVSSNATIRSLHG